ncbi:2-hydroxyacid dehydrogenase [Nesterenkonia alkaliphila]|uniref:D-glycerate dehydrogenase n=1 Tax=Nesterenkonia alkaliphila TaxID=1463631 RepID=A0A7K1UFF6_9MICC|nr:D-glycerate dehydrogenase [Nesterenkonia alkaliphila]MVT25205.1 D-glycerate dehydrogenase [Nesterenkonia alkaliphila]GFZ97605.1 D-glycerate dehydrogenase [Nesterenkonia alkaliphila]
MGHVYLSRSVGSAAEEFSAQLGRELRIGSTSSDPPSREEFLEGVRGAEAILSLVTDRIDAQLLDAAGDQLKVVANVGVGYDNIDVAAAQERGVTVTNTPGVLDDAVADLTLALILATTRRVVESDRKIRTGEPWIWGPQDYVGLQISAGARLGIVGLGRIGMAVAKRAASFGMEIIATGRRAHDDDAAALGVRPAELPELLATSDVLSLHCPLKPETRHLINQYTLAAMKPGSYLINTGRGPLVDEQALADALDSGHLAGAGLDVHEFEPQTNPRLRAMEQVVLLHHIGSAGDKTRYDMAALAFRNASAVLNGEDPLTPVTH